MKKLSSDQWLGLVMLMFAVVLVFVWVPLDTETGLLQKVRRRVLIGDALAPTIAGGVLALGAALTWVKPDPDAPSLTVSNLKWLLSLCLVFAVSLGLMRYLGPVLASVLTEGGYRPLRDTLPWKYVGYIAGGTVMVAGLSGLSQRRPVWLLVAVGGTAALLIAMAYDLPFDDLLLPPNGDI